MTRERKRISLVLGSGGARGHAHVGVIRALEERRVQIRNIAGTSMGAVVGGIYAAGELDTYVEWATHLRKGDVLRLLDFSFTRTSVFKGERIIEVLKDLIGDRQIEDLEIGFTAVATALEEQKEIWLNKGSLFTAIKASIAVPGVFSPVSLGGRLLVDGGLVNPIPIAPTLYDPTDLTLAVNLNAVTEHYRRPAREAGPESADEEGYRAAIGRFISRLLAEGEKHGQPPDAFDLLTHSIDVMQGAIARLKLAAYAPDIVVNVPRDACSFFEFYRAAEMAELGYERTLAALDNADL